MGISSAYPCLRAICDILYYERFSEVSFCADYLNIGTVKIPEIASQWDCLPSLWV